MPLLLKADLTILIFSSAPACVWRVELNAYTLGIVRLGLASLGMIVLVERLSGRPLVGTILVLIANALVMWS